MAQDHLFTGRVLGQARSPMPGRHDIAAITQEDGSGCPLYLSLMKYGRCLILRSQK